MGNIHGGDRARLVVTGRRVLLIAVLATLAVAPMDSRGTLASFTGTKNASATVAARTAYSCSVDYPTMISGTSGLLNYWRLGEPYGSTTAVDQTGSANGTYTNNPSLAAARAHSSMGSDTSAAFDGASYMSAGDINDFTGSAPYTIEAWVRRDSPSEQYDAVVAKEEGMPRDGWNLRLMPESGGYRVLSERFNNGNYGSNILSNSRLTLGKWHHLALTFTGSSMSLYVNGELDVTNPYGDTGLRGTAGPLTVSGANWQGSVGARFNGAIDEVAIYNRALTQNEIQSHTANCTYSSVVSRTPNLRSYWRLDENDGSTALDSGPAGVNGNFINGATPGAKGALSSNTRTGLALDASASQNVDLGNNYNFAGNAAFSFEAWLKPNAHSATEYGQIVAFDRYVPSRDQWTMFQLPGSNNLSFERWVNGVYAGVQTSTPTSLTQWTHAVGTYDGSTLRLYVNGSLVGSWATAASMPVFTGPLRLGLGSNYGNAFGGAIDEVAVYDRALSGPEVAAHYAAR